MPVAEPKGVIYQFQPQETLMVAEDSVPYGEKKDKQ